MATESSRIETRTAVDDDEPFGDAGRPGRGLTIKGPRGPLLTLVTRILWQLGVFCVFSFPVWVLPVAALLSAEGLTEPWMRDQLTNRAGVMSLISIGVGLALMLVGAHPGWLLALGVAAA